MIDEAKLRLDYTETLATQLNTTVEEANKLVTDEDLAQVIDEMYEAETDHINNNLPYYQRLYNDSRNGTEDS